MDVCRGWVFLEHDDDDDDDENKDMINLPV